MALLVVGRARVVYGGGVVPTVAPRPWIMLTGWVRRGLLSRLVLNERRLSMV